MPQNLWDRKTGHFLFLAATSVHVARVASRQSSTVYGTYWRGVPRYIHVRTLKRRKNEKIKIKTFTYARTYGRCVNNR